MVGDVRHEPLIINQMLDFNFQVTTTLHLQGQHKCLVMSILLSFVPQVIENFSMFDWRIMLETMTQEMMMPLMMVMMRVVMNRNRYRDWDRNWNRYL